MTIASKTTNDALPTTGRQWTLNGRGSLDKLSFEEHAEVPKVGDNEVLVNIKAVSLNYRDISLIRGTYPFPAKDPVVPLSDGAGTVLAVGPRVTRFSPGDNVMPGFHPSWLYGRAPSIADMGRSLGAPADGVLRDYIVLPEDALTRAPKGWTHAQAATLPCAALTVWDAFYGLEGRKLGQGDWVLTQGSGGVSVFAIQLAKAAGARVVATTSSPAKAERLRALGADVVINYKTTPEWADAARAATTGSVGFDHIIEVGGPGTLAQSIKCIARQGVISVIGFIAPGEGTGSGEGMPGMLDALSSGCIVRGIFVGNREKFEELVRGVEAAGVEPVVDERVFGMGEVKEAYEHMEAQKHFGKVVIEL